MVTFSIELFTCIEAPYDERLVVFHGEYFRVPRLPPTADEMAMEHRA
jgi:hypothetical protein